MANAIEYHFAQAFHGPHLSPDFLQSESIWKSNALDFISCIDEQHSVPFTTLELSLALSAYGCCMCSYASEFTL